MTYEPVKAVEVRAWHRLVGAVAQNPATGAYAFRYDDEWAAGGVELAPLHMPLSDHTFEFGGLPRDTFFGLPPLLADALPDRFGNALVNAWMADNGIAAAEITPLDRLAYASDRALGALEFRPPARSGATHASSAVQLADLVVSARQAVRGDLGTGDTSNAALRQLIQVGTSAGGARAKAVVAYDPSTNQLRSAYTDLEPGFEHWLIKLDGVSSSGMDGHDGGLGASAPYGRIEYAYHLMATQAGIDMADCVLLAEGPRRHFMTKRFDRGSSGQRHHLISLCGLAHLDFNLIATHSYGQLFQTVDELDLGSAARGEAFRRMVFNVLAYNRDDHTKNIAFLRPEHSGWHLAPAYDLTFAYNPGSKWTARHLMSVNGRFDQITDTDLREVGDRHAVPGCRRIISEVREAVVEWQHFAHAADLDEETTEGIATVLKSP